MKELAEGDRHWLAGLFEGEGCIVILDNGRAIRAELGMSDKDVIDSLHSITGIGAIHQRTKKSIRHKDYWIWRVEKLQDVKDFIAAILPLMHSRRTERMVEVLAMRKAWEIGRPMTYAERVPIAQRARWAHCADLSSLPPFERPTEYLNARLDRLNP